MTFIFLIFFILYFAFAVFFIRSIWKTSSKLQRRLVIAFFVLLPSWDMVLGYIIYYAALPFVPKVAVYETAETDGIYYEGDYHNTVLIVKDWEGNEILVGPFDTNDYMKGYQYVESLVTVIQEGGLGKKVTVSPPVVYRCFPRNKEIGSPSAVYSKCAPVGDIRSRYVVKTKRLKFARNEMNFLTICNRSTGQLLGEYREVIRLGYDFIPFFIWLDWAEGNPERFSCPENSRLWDFQYDVLKLRR
jgi:hypothetical protein